MLSQNQDFALWGHFADQTTSFQSTHLWHTDVEQHHIRIQALYFIHGFRSVLCFIDHFPVRLQAKQGPQPVSDNWVIIHKENAYHHTVFALRVES